jgi:hypothetical protein
MPSKLSAGRSPQYQPTINFVEDSPPRISRIDLNTASPTELQRLPGINEASARKIAAARKKQKFNHVDDLVAMKLVSRSTFARIRKMVHANGNDIPYINDVKTQPEHVLYRKSFRLDILFDDSISGVRLVRLEVDSVSHSLDLTREVTPAERRQGSVTFELPAMEAGVMNIQVSLYDDAGNKDYLARTFTIFHNPPTVTFFPSERSLRLSNGAALKKSDGNFHCDSNFFFSNGTGSTATLSRNMAWRITSQSGGLLWNGSWDWGSNIVLSPWSTSTGWWFNFWFSPGHVVGQRLQARESIRITYEFTEVGTGTLVSDSLSWRAVLGPNVNIIRVGEENFTNTERTLVFNALRSSASSIYQQQDLDIGTISTWIIRVADAGGYVTIDSNGEAEDLTSDWTVSNDSMDLFVVRSYVGSVAGLSPVNGSCDKDAKGMNGSVVELQSGQQLLGVIMAHELGHYLGLSHTSATNNVMNPTVSNSTTLLSGTQGTTMKSHCFIRFLG